MNLSTATVKKEYTIDSVSIEDKELNAFLFSLGCYSGEPITLIKQSKHGCIISLKDARYSIDNRLANAISVR